jgi:replication initiation protein RepC
VSVSVAHQGLPAGIGFRQLFDLAERLRKPLHLSRTAVAVLRHNLSGCRKDDLLPGRICGLWEQPASIAEKLGISTRVLANAEAELRNAGLIERTSTPHARRSGKRDKSGAIVSLLGISLKQFLNRFLELSEICDADDMRKAAMAKLRDDIAALRAQLRRAENADLIAKSEQILPRGRTSRIAQQTKLTAIKVDLEALLAAIKLPSGEQKSSDRTEESFSPIIPSKNPSQNCSRMKDERVAYISPIRAAQLASDDYQQLVFAKGGASWSNIVETSAVACNWLGISGKVWGDACATFGRQRAALCVLVIDRNRRLPENHRYHRKHATGSLLGMMRVGAAKLNVTGLMRAIEGYPDGIGDKGVQMPLTSVQRSLSGVTRLGDGIAKFMAGVQISDVGAKG